MLISLCTQSNKIWSVLNRKHSSVRSGIILFVYIILIYVLLLADCLSLYNSSRNICQGKDLHVLSCGAHTGDFL